MTDNRDVTEQHGCLVCGRSYNLLVVYGPDGRYIDAAVTSPGGRRVPDPEWLLVACDRHSPAEIDAALARRKAQAERQRRGEDERDE
jgi:hypothetical protein